MNKIGTLYNYLIKNNYLLEANYLYKIAKIDEEKYKQEYPVMYEAWEDRSNNNVPDKPWRAYANLLKQLEDRSIEFDKSKVYTFDEIKNLLITRKDQTKTEEQDELINFLNKKLPQTKYLQNKI